jgi:hypothetical protein
MDRDAAGNLVVQCVIAALLVWAINLLYQIKDKLEPEPEPVRVVSTWDGFI